MRATTFDEPAKTTLRLRMLASQLLGRKCRGRPEHPPVAGCDRQPGGVDEVGILRPGAIELHAQLVRAPAVVVVEERDPGMRRSLDPAVARTCHAAAGRVAQHGDAWVAERLERLRRTIARTVVDDDDLELDVPLAERRDARCRRRCAPGRASGSRRTRLQPSAGRLAVSMMLGASTWRGCRRRCSMASSTAPTPFRPTYASANDARTAARGRRRPSSSSPGAQERAGEQRPGDGTTAVLDDDHVVPAVEQLPQRARRVAVLDDVAVVLPHHRDGHDHPSAWLDDAPELSDAVRRIGDVVERLDARDAVVAAVGARQELGRDDVGHAVAVVDVQPDDAHAGRVPGRRTDGCRRTRRGRRRPARRAAPARAAGRPAAAADADSRTATAADAGACGGRRAGRRWRSWAPHLPQRLPRLFRQPDDEAGGQAAGEPAAPVVGGHRPPEQLGRISRTASRRLERRTERSPSRAARGTCCTSALDRRHTGR